MSKYSTLKAEIIASIKRNGAQAITGDLLQEKLLSMIDSLGEHYQFGGLALPSTGFTAGDEPVVFIAATPGTYTDFGGLVVADGEVALLVWDGSTWSKQTTDIATRTEVSQLGQEIFEKTRFTTQIENDFILGNYDNSGVKVDSPYYAIYNKKRLIYSGASILKIKLYQGFNLTIYCWDNESGNFLGRLSSDGTIKSTGFTLESSSSTQNVEIQNNTNYDILFDCRIGKGSYVQEITITEANGSIEISINTAISKEIELLNNVELSIDLELYVKNDGYYIASASNQWANQVGQCGYYIPVKTGYKYKIKANDNIYSAYAFLNSLPTQTGVTPDYMTGTTRETVSAGNEMDIVSPGNGYLWIYKNTSAGENKPSYFAQFGAIEDVLVNEIQNIETEISDIKVITEESKSSIEQIKDYVDFNNLPSYFDSELLDTAEKIQNASDEGPTLTISYVTDPHMDWTERGKERVEENISCMRALSKIIPIDGVAMLGDIPAMWGRDGVGDTEIYRRFNWYIGKFRNAIEKFYFTNGNHDGDSADFFNNSHLYKLSKYNRGFVNREDNSPYYYIDYSDMKVRVIFMSIPCSTAETRMTEGITEYYPAEREVHTYWGAGKKQLNWLANVALKTGDDWEVILFSHVPINYDYQVHNGIYDLMGRVEDHVDIEGIFNAYQNQTTYSNGDISADFSQYSNTKVLVAIAGHLHADEIFDIGSNNGRSDFIANEMPCKIVVTSCEKLNGRSDKSVDQELWDTMVYNKVTNKIKFIRFGYGNDREITI